VFSVGRWGRAAPLWQLARALVKGEPSRGEGQGFGQRFNRGDGRHGRFCLRGPHCRICQPGQPGQRSHSQPALLASSPQPLPDPMGMQSLACGVVSVEPIGKETGRESERGSDFLNCIEPRNVARFSFNVEDGCSRS